MFPNVACPDYEIFHTLFHTLIRPGLLSGPLAYPGVVMAGFVDESLKRSSNDICLYITKPGEGSRKMVLYKPGDTWQTFLDAVSSRLVSRARTSHNARSLCNDRVSLCTCFVHPFTRFANVKIVNPNLRKFR